MAVVPNPAACTLCGGGSSTPGVDVEDLVLCDYVAGEVVGSAIAVYEYDDTTGAPIGPPTFVIPGTNTPYVVQGILQACLGEGCGAVTSELVCDNTAEDVYTPYILTQVWNCDGTLSSSSTRDLTGAAYVPLGIPGTCPDNEAQFAGFVCDVFGGSPEIPAIPPTCPGSALGAAAAFLPGAGMTEGPAGTWTQTANIGASLTWNNSPSDDQHAICAVQFVNDPTTGDNPLWQLIGSIVDLNSNVLLLDAVWITAIEVALGVGDLSDIPSGSTASAPVGGTTVTITFDGPSPHSQMWAGNGAFFVRQGDADGLAAGVTLEFNPPVKSFTLALNNATGDPGTISGIQESQATPGTAAIPAQPPGVFQVKQFRNTDGTAFYENPDGTVHSVLGSIGQCDEFFQEQLCDATGAAFIRLYSISGGAVSGFQDYDLSGAVFAAVNPVGRCSETLATFRHTPPEVLCYTAEDGVTVTQFLRRYLIEQNGISVVAVIDTLLDGLTPFVAAVGGNVALCCCEGSTSGTACATASSIGTVCYIPPVFVPATAMTDDWTGSSVVGVNGGPQTITNSNFFGAGRTVEMTLTKGAGLTGAAVLLGVAPTVANALYQQHLDLGGMVTGLDVTFNSFGTLGSEILRNFSPAFDSIVGSGSAVLGNTGINPTAPNGTVTVHWNGPLSAVDFDWRSQAGGTLSTVSTVSFTTVASGSSTATQGTAAVLVDCETGAVTYRDLATGLVIDIDDFTIVDCGLDSGSTGFDVEIEQLCDAVGARFLRKYVYDGDTGVFASVTDTLLDGSTAFAPVNPITTCPLPILGLFDTEQQILCDVNGTRFLRAYVYDSDTPGSVLTTDTTLNGVTPFAPVGTVSVCPGTAVVTRDEELAVLVDCPGGVAFLRKFNYDGQTGAFISAVDTTLNGSTPYVVVGTASQTCSTPVTLIAVSADHFEAVPGTPWTPAAIPVGRRLTSITYTVLTGTATVVDAIGGTSIATIPAGYTATWNAQNDNETLTPPASITSVGGRVIVLMTTAV